MKKETVLASLLFILVSLFFFYPLLKGFVPFPGDLLVGEYSPYNSYSFQGFAPGGFPNKGQDFDVLRLLYPAKEFSINALKSLDVPFWNQYNFSGNPHLASLQSGSLYPLNVLFFLFPFNFAWSIYIISSPVLTLIFTYFLLRAFRFDIKSSIFGSLVFAYSSYQIVWIEYGNIGHSILWLPLLMFLSLKNIKKPSVPISILIIFSITFSILAGYLQTTFYLYVFLFAFVLFKIITQYRDKLFSRLIIFVPIFILPLLLSSIQLLPTIELIFNSARSPYELSSFLKLLIPNIHMITFFVPDFFGNPATRNYWLDGTYIERVSYIGVLPLLFAVYGIIKKPKKIVWFFIIAIIIVGLITFDSFFSRTLYSLFLPPVISTAVPSRIMFIFSFALSFLATYGIDYLQKEKINKRFWISVLLVAGVYIFLWVFVIVVPIIIKDQSWTQYLKISLRNLVIPSVLFFSGAVVSYSLLKYKNFKTLSFVIILLLTVFDLFYFFHKITPFSPPESVYPKTQVLEYLKTIQGINRSWGYGSAYMDANIQTLEKNFSTNGYDALHIKRYGELLSSSNFGKISKSISGSNADIIQGYGESDLRNNYHRKRLLDLLGVKYILNKVNPESNFLPDYKTFPGDSYKLVWQKGAWQIYENTKAFPRFYLASDYIVETDKQKIVSLIFDKDFNIRETLILEEKVPSANFKSDKNATVTMISYSSNKVILKTKSTENTLLFLSDNYYPGWEVLIDGKINKIYRANYSFRAVPVKKGEHEIIFSYYPESFDLGLKISLTAFFSIIIFSMIDYIIKHRRQNDGK